ncbi:uncharacterized protein involved in type VI secretion and phage assembly [Chitinophaga polysaccharea]|uniref:Uncharacterized protein involved in type VI secretion and phage assembly n=1 Tax=Chitinophaga polysaccharea TaxID=1293035 RepID=A0A561PGB4_9BACT|nr:phage baseplate assembly protein V [Chitinophaga polysaccharea]TWF37090.1 uncharacterized protein involved in type VI secretion and phage assembly [Chitinophaga polysaccharea]
MLHTITTVSIADKQFKQFHSLRLEQPLQGHHHFELKIGYDWLQELGPGIVSATKAFLGKEVSITIQPYEPLEHYEPLVFNGIVMSVSSGKESDGTHGFCVIRGYSPTMLLNNDLHIQSFENQELSSIVHTALKACGPYISRPLVEPNTSASLKYIVQYKETSFDFLHRMSERFGEWFFYNGQQVVFGKYQPRDISLVHLVDLMSFDLEMKVAPNNQHLNGYDYRSNKVVDNTTLAQPSGKVDDYTQHVQGVSEKLYSNTSLYKMNHAFTSNAKAELDTLVTRQKKGRMASMVQLKGSSRHTALRVGDHISIKENVYAKDDHGKFMIWGLTHHVTGNGDYYNEFEGIPADAAAPPVNLENIPNCEAQSAVVVDNHDPKDLGRVKARFKWQQQGTTPWMRVLAPHGGGSKGMYMIPEKGEEIVVDFEGGNPELPYVLGTTYNGEGKSGFGTAANDMKAIRTRSGISILLNDAQGSVTIEDPSGNKVFMDGKEHISISSKTKISISSKEIEISSETFSMTASKTGSIIATKDLHVEGTESAVVKGKDTLVKADSSLSMLTKEFLAQGSTTAHVMGDSVTMTGKKDLSVNSPADIMVSGGLVKINS